MLTMALPNMLRSTSLLLGAASSLAACAPTAEMFYGSEGYGGELVRGEEPLSMEEAQSLIGQSYYIGGPGGTLGSTQVAGIDLAGACNNADYAIVLETSAPAEPFIASKKPLTFLPITLSPDARPTLVPQIQDFLRAEKIANGLIADDVWRFTTPAASYFLAVAHSPRDLDEGAIGRPGDFDVLLLFQERDGKPVLIGHDMTMLTDGGGKLRAWPFPLAVTVDPADQRVEFFIHYLFYEGDEVTGYDLSHDRLEERTTGGCYY
jgi:hypothetical protein